jgi:hypothetical protein
MRAQQTTASSGECGFRRDALVISAKPSSALPATKRSWGDPAPTATSKVCVQSEMSCLPESLRTRGRDIVAYSALGPNPGNGGHTRTRRRGQRGRPACLRIGRGPAGCCPMAPNPGSASGSNSAQPAFQHSPPRDCWLGKGKSMTSSREAGRSCHPFMIRAPSWVTVLARPLL